MGCPGCTRGRPHRVPYNSGPTYSGLQDDSIYVFRKYFIHSYGLNKSSISDSLQGFSDSLASTDWSCRSFESAREPSGKLWHMNILFVILHSYRFLVSSFITASLRSTSSHLHLVLSPRNANSKQCRSHNPPSRKSKLSRSSISKAKSGFKS